MISRPLIVAAEIGGEYLTRFDDFLHYAHRESARTNCRVADFDACQRSVQFAAFSESLLRHLAGVRELSPILSLCHSVPRTRQLE